ncbi:hypothetical protein JOQ06_026526 [Pogonophryne albipinna]|uniref:Uncharacterized protein n=1 Tax=Pogonophryne albipinna TaxID=1090488 RepID=A0AAD6B8P8_9TELE|nr:hypothetical protein JOQ06_026526 [Pogonophryne albipinna]
MLESALIPLRDTRACGEACSCTEFYISRVSHRGSERKGSLINLQLHAVSDDLNTVKDSQSALTRTYSSV